MSRRLAFAGCVVVLASLAGCGGGGGSNSFTSTPSSPPPPTTTASGLTINTSIPGAAAGQPYSATLTANNGTPPYKWASLNGIPAGLTLTPAGVLSGTADQYFGGDLKLQIQVTDSANPTNTVTAYVVYDVFNVSPNSFNVGQVGLDYSQLGWVQAQGGTDPISYSVAGTLPPGLKFQKNPAAAASDTRSFDIAGTPTQAGHYQFSITAQDSSSPKKTVTRQYSIDIEPPALVLQGGGALPPSAVGQPYTYTFQTSGGQAPYHWLTMGQTLPAGLNFDASTGRLSGTPTATGYANFVVRATDSSAPTPQIVDRSYWLLTTPAPLPPRNDSIANATPIVAGDSSSMNSYDGSISPYTDANGAGPDQDYYTLTVPPGGVLTAIVGAQGADPTKTSVLDPVLEIVDANGARLATCNDPYYDNLPAGSPVTPNPSPGTFQDPCMNHGGDPSQAPTVAKYARLVFKTDPMGSATAVYLHVFDWRGDARPDMSYLLSVAVDTSAVIKPLVISTMFLPNGSMANPYNYILSGAGGYGTLQWNVTAGQLPPGVSLSSAGVLNGTPTASGDYTFTVTLSDQSTPIRSASQQYTVSIGTVMKVATISLPQAQTGVPYSFTFQATGGVAPYYWQIVARPLSNSDFVGTGTISGIPSQVGTFTVGATVSDNSGQMLHTSLPLTVVAGPLYFGQSPSDTAYLGGAYIRAIDIEGGTSPYQVQVVSGSLPPGMSVSIDPVRGWVISGTPTATGTFNFTLSVTDSGSPAQTATTQAWIRVG